MKRRVWTSGDVVWAASIIGFACTATFALATFAVSQPFLPFWTIVPFFVGLFGVHVRTVFGLRPWGRAMRWGGKEQLRLARRIFSARELAVFGIAFLASWAIGMAAIAQASPGQPEKHHGRYYADSHGALTEITRKQYDHLYLAGERVFTAIPACFYLVAVAYGLADLRRRRHRSAPPVPA